MRILASLVAFSLVLPLFACSAADTSQTESSDDHLTQTAGKLCKVPNGGPGFVCDQEYDPVCGCDGKTYGNACEAANHVTGTTPGACPEADAGACELAHPTLPVNCAQDYDPVCGCDGKTYGNACEAASYVTETTPGACQ